MLPRMLHALTEFNATCKRFPENCLLKMGLSVENIIFIFIVTSVNQGLSNWAPGTPRGRKGLRGSMERLREKCKSK